MVFSLRDSIINYIKIYTHNIYIIRITRYVMDLENEIRNLLETRYDEPFQDGMDSEFGIELENITKQHGNTAVNIIRQCWNKTNYEEALRILGNMEHEDTHEARLDLMIAALQSDDSRIRDVASIGISNMRDRMAIPSLKTAIRREQNSQLKTMLKQVLAQLELI